MIFLRKFFGTVVPTIQFNSLESVFDGEIDHGCSADLIVADE